MGPSSYYSAPALARMLSVAGLLPVTSWQFGLYGGTVLLAARRGQDDYGGPDESVASLLAAEDDAGITDPAVVSGLQRDASARADALREWLVAMRLAGQTVLG